MILAEGVLTSSDLTVQSQRSLFVPSQRSALKKYMVGGFFFHFTFPNHGTFREPDNM
jgi:hypothetical protein